MEDFRPTALPLPTLPPPGVSSPPCREMPCSGPEAGEGPSPVSLQHPGRCSVSPGLGMLGGSCQAWGTGPWTSGLDSPDAGTGTGVNSATAQFAAAFGSGPEASQWQGPGV